MVDRRALVELGIMGILSYFLFFVSTNVNPTLGGIYQGLALLGIALTIVDISYGKKSLFLINEKIPWGKAILISFVAYIVLIFSTNFTSGIAKAVPLTEILSLLGATAPVFSASPTINFLIFAVVIPYIETYVIFGVAIDLFSSVFKIELSRRNIFATKLLVLITLISLSFLLFHTNAKGIENESALILVAIMGLITSWLIIWYKEFRIPILFHMFANTIAFMATSGFAIVPRIIG